MPYWPMKSLSDITSWILYRLFPALRLSHFPQFLTVDVFIREKPFKRSSAVKTRRNICTHQSWGSRYADDHFALLQNSSYLSQVYIKCSGSNYLHRCFPPAILINTQFSGCLLNTLDQRLFMAAILSVDKPRAGLPALTVGFTQLLCLYHRYLDMKIFFSLLGGLTWPAFQFTCQINWKGLVLPPHSIEDSKLRLWVTNQRVGGSRPLNLSLL